jgi:hypothetical protein
MRSTIVNPNPIQIISRIKECMDTMMEAGLTFEALQKPINDPEMRQRLINFWLSGARYPAIMRKVKVDRNFNVTQATQRVQNIRESVLDTAPMGQGLPEEVELHYFCLGRDVSDDDLAYEYDYRGLIPDPQAQATDNEIDPAFADEYPNATHWKNSKGQWCSITFYRLLHDRYIGAAVHGCSSIWHGSWWFAGRPK